MQWADILGRAEVTGVEYTETPTLIPGYSGVPEGHKTAGIMEANSQEHLLYVPVWKDTKTRGKEEEGALLVSKVTQRKPPKPKLGDLDRTVGERCCTQSAPRGMATLACCTPFCSRDLGINDRPAT